MQYDFLIKNGFVVDFESMAVAKKDVLVQKGKIVSVAGQIPADQANSAFVIDASEKYVLPGLIDEHTHLNYMNNAMGANADLLCIPSGITTAFDAGTAGWSNFDGFYHENIARTTTNVKAYLHAAPYGMMCGCIHQESHDPADFVEDKIMELFEKYPKVLRGIKIRMCRETLGDFGYAPLERAVEIANRIEVKGHFCKVVVHVHDLPQNVGVSGILSRLRAGDLFVHVFQPVKETVFDEKGHIRQCVREARARGVLMDCSNGRPHWSFDTLRWAREDEFYPDIISSDVIRFSQYLSPGFSLLHAMAVCSCAGWDTLEILKRVTYNPAKYLGVLDEAGTLDVGTPADICVMDIRQTDQVFHDMHGGSCRGNQLFVPLLTMKDGEIVFRQIFYV